MPNDRKKGRARPDVVMHIKATPEQALEALFRQADQKAGIKSPFTEPAGKQDEKVEVARP